MTYRLHYISADAPGPDAPWSVYSEEYTSIDDEGDPIEGSGRHISSWPSEDEARAESERLQKEANR